MQVVSFALPIAGDSPASENEVPVVELKGSDQTIPVGCEPSTFRLPPRFRNSTEDERDDALDAKQSPNSLIMAHTMPTGPDDVHRQSAVSQQPIYLQYPAAPRRATWSSWTSVSSGNTETGGPSWRRHFRTDSDGIVTAATASPAAAPSNCHAASTELPRSTSLTEAEYQALHRRYTQIQAWPHHHRVGLRAVPVAVAVAPHRQDTRAVPVARTSAPYNQEAPPNTDAVAIARRSQEMRSGHVAMIPMRHHQGMRRAFVETCTSHQRQDVSLVPVAASMMQHHQGMRTASAATATSQDHQRMRSRHVATATTQHREDTGSAQHNQDMRSVPVTISTAQHYHGMRSLPVAMPSAQQRHEALRWQRSSGVSVGYSNVEHRGSIQYYTAATTQNSQPWQHSSQMTAERRHSPFVTASSSGSAQKPIELSNSEPSWNAPQSSKRWLSPTEQQQQRFKKAKGFDKLDLLCTATLEIGELHDNPTGCSCPKSKCIALYCDCFKAGRRCDPKRCACLDCKNTITESGIDGARTKAIRCILARNPRAFNTAGVGNPTLKLPPGEVACNCVRSRCLKLYCSCFHNGKACKPDVCTCVGCYNTESDTDGHRQAAIQQAIEKRADAFVIKAKEKGHGCACKNNRCVRKYCECFRTGLGCTEKCTCRGCENREN